MKLLCLVLVLLSVRKVTPLHCRCTGATCDDPILDTCYTTHSCISETIGRNTTYGCTPFRNYEKFYCGISTKFRKTKCCKTDLCNSQGFPAKPFLAVPSIKLASLVRGKAIVNITDSSHVRAKISGYIATMYIPGENGRRIKYLAAHTRLFLLDKLYVKTTYVIEVSAYRGHLVSERSKTITFTTESPKCNRYKKGEPGLKKTESCHGFGCYALWYKNGTSSFVLQERGCWNDVEESKCTEIRGALVPYVMCICKTQSCTIDKRRIIKDL